jgi:hypothetical protein
MGKDWSKDERSWKMGQDVESSRFRRVLSFIDPNPREASRDEQFEHIDYYTIIGTVDVKAMKRVTRSGERQAKFLWVEFRNTAGMNGWLYGKQDWMAFEKPDGFLFVRREDLKELAIELCDTDTYVDSARDALYKVYSRKDTDDVISMIKYSDLDRIPSFFIRDSDKEEETTPFL